MTWLKWQQQKWDTPQTTANEGFREMKQPNQMFSIRCGNQKGLWEKSVRYALEKDVCKYWKLQGKTWKNNYLVKDNAGSLPVYVGRRCSWDLALNHN